MTSGCSKVLWLFIARAARTRPVAVLEAAPRTSTTILRGPLGSVLPIVRCITPRESHEAVALTAGSESPPTP
jgi:hypothetical protein